MKPFYAVVRASQSWVAAKIRQSASHFLSRWSSICQRIARLRQRVARQRVARQRITRLSVTRQRATRLSVTRLSVTRQRATRQRITR
jgi:hypothetical protein